MASWIKINIRWAENGRKSSFVTRCIEALQHTYCPGDRVRIRAFREIGSARLLDGIGGKIIALHPVATGWFKIRLDPNGVTPHTEWSAPGDRLVPEESPLEEEAPQISSVRIFP
jgi:hypothetical protein